MVQAQFSPKNNLLKVKSRIWTETSRHLENIYQIIITVTRLLIRSSVILKKSISYTEHIENMSNFPNLASQSVIYHALSGWSILLRNCEKTNFV